MPLSNRKPDIEEPLPLRVGELFVGAGGFGLGFILANHPKVRYCPVFAIDNDPVALESYRANMQWLTENAPDVLHNMPKIIREDIASLDMSHGMQNHNFEEIDILIGGPPCQGFSSSNKTRRIQDKHSRNNLISVFLDKVSDLSPKMFLMENVQGVKWTNLTEEMKLPEYQCCDSSSIAVPTTKVKEFLEEKSRILNYEIWSDFQDAADFGVPQHRKRFLLFGVHRDLLNDDQTISLISYLDKLKIAKKVSVREAISDLPELENGQEKNTDYQPNAENKYVTSLRQYMKNGEIFDHFATNHTKKILERFVHIPQGENWRSVREQLSTTYTHIENTHSNIYRRLCEDEPANTISHYRKSMIIHPVQNRGLSFREACRLQSCPDWFRFEGTRDQKQQQLANMVPPLMAAKVAYAIAEYWLEVFHNGEGD